MAEIGRGELELDADTSGLEKGMADAKKSVYGFATTVKGAGITMQLAGAVVLGFAASTVLASVKFEDAFSGVRKTVDATEAEFLDLEKRLRSIAMREPIPFEDLARIATVAGQLGIRGVDNLEKFTNTVARMAVATELTAEEAAFNLARFSNIMQMPIDQVDRLAATIVHMGNTFAATEPEIAALAMNIAGAAKVVGMTETEVVALATAIAAVGVRAQKGGTAISRTFVDIAKAVSKGGEDLEKYALVAGTAADEFAEKWRTKPMEAFTLWLRGLNRIQESGGDLIKVMDALGIKQIRQADVVRRLALSYDTVVAAVGESDRAWSENTALMVEVYKKYGTAASAIQVLINNAVELAAKIGDTVTPMLMILAEYAKEVTQAIGEWVELHPKLTAFGIAAMGLAGALTILAGTALIAFAVIGIAGPALASVAGMMGTITLTAAGLAAAAIVIYYSWQELGKLFFWFYDVLDTVTYGLSLGMIAMANVFTASMDAIYTVVSTVAVAVYEFLMLLNPFASFSPSLVDQVVAGVDIIVAKYGELIYIKGPIGDAIESISGLKEAIATVTDEIETRQTAALDKALVLLGADTPVAYAKAVTAVQTLEDAIYDLDVQIEREEDELDRVGVLLEINKDQHERTKKKVDDLKDAIKGVTDAYNDWTDAQLVGTEAYEDELFDLQQLLAAAELELMEAKESPRLASLLEQIKGVNSELERQRDLLHDVGDANVSEIRKLEDMIRSYRDLMREASDADKAFLRDNIATLEARKAALKRGEEDNRTEIQRTIAALEKQAEELEAQFDGVTQPFQDELDDLRDRIRKLRLREQLEMDPLIRDIEKAADTTKEWTYDEIIQGMADAKAEQATLNDQLALAEGLFGTEEGILSDLEVRYDTQKEKVNDLTAARRDLNTILREFETVITETSATAEGELRKVEKAAKESAGGISDIVDEMGKLGDEDLQAKLEESRKRMDEIAESAAKFTEKVEDLKEDIKKFTDFIEDINFILGAGFFVLFTLIAAGWDGLLLGFQIWGEAIWAAAKWVGEKLALIWGEIVDIATTIWNGIVEDLRGVWGTLVNIVGYGVAVLSVILGAAWTTIVRAVTYAWAIIETVITGAITVVSKAWDGLVTGIKSIWNNGLRPVFQAMADAYNRTIGALAGWLPGVPGSIGPVPHLAAGIRGFGGGFALVGESGPELLALPPESDVLSNQETQRVLGDTWTNYGTIRNEFPNVRDARGVIKELDRPFRRF